MTLKQALGVFQEALHTPTTQGQLLLKLAQTLPEDDPERLFTEWLYKNKGRWQEACHELGVEPPKEGPRLLQRLREAVLCKLTK